MHQQGQGTLQKAGTQHEHAERPEDAVRLPAVLAVRVRAARRGHLAGAELQVDHGREDEHDGHAERGALDHLDDGDVREGHAHVEADAEQAHGGEHEVRVRRLVPQGVPGGAHPLEGVGEVEDRGDHHAEPGQLHHGVVRAVALEDVSKDLVAKARVARDAEGGEEDGRDRKGVQCDPCKVGKGLLLQLCVVGWCVVVRREGAVEERQRFEHVKLHVPEVFTDRFHGLILSGMCHDVVEDVRAGNGGDHKAYHRGVL
mmetsp:Transcript_84159/g.261795  ORF Transcript_84159/g.261795 Transcript_84159/m.261795 type:complete len:257 (+) Transcript_84159:57-827(+)